MKRSTRILLAASVGLGLFAAFCPDGSEPPRSTPTLRNNALALCGLYLPCSRGDAHFAEICKDYGGIGTTCGYLPAWMLFRLGCRDPRLVNREEPGAGLHYRVAMNIADLVSGGKAIGCWRLYHPGNEPEPGDILYFQATDFVRGQSHNPREHVAVCVSCPPGGTGELVTYDLGHSIQPEGSLTRRTMRAGVVSFLGGDRTLVGVDNLSMIPFSAPADLTDHTKEIVVA